MHFEPRLWIFTEGVRLRIVAAVLIGLAAVGLGVARMGLLGWLIGEVFAGRGLPSLALPIALIALVMVMRAVFEHWRAIVAHKTASRVQKRLRRTLYDRIAALGPGTVGSQRSGALSLSLIDGVEQLEVYFGQFLPQFLISLLTPVLIFVAVAFIDLPVAAVMLAFAVIALFAPALWHRYDAANALSRQKAYAAFAAEFLDSIQGLATLKAFGQSRARAEKLEIEANTLFKRTMRVLGTNVLSRGITDSAIASGAAAALAIGAFRVEAGAMELGSLLIILMLGVEVFRPMRELRTVLHEGMVGMSAAQGIYQILDGRPLVADSPGAALAAPLEPTIAFEGVRFHYPGTRRIVHDGLEFHAGAGERIGIVGASGGGKSSIVRLLLRFYDPNRGRHPSRRQRFAAALVRADPRAHFRGEPGHIPVPRHGRGKHPHGPPACDPGGDRGRGQGRQHPQLCRNAAPWLPDRHRRKRHQAFRRATPARRHRPGRCSATRPSWCWTRRYQPWTRRMRR